METDADPYISAIMTFTDVRFFPFNIGIVTGILVLIFLLCASALISGSEVACFSLSPANRMSLRQKESKRNTYLLQLIGKPERLLATILITNNFVNIGIVILSTLFFVYEDEPITSLAMVDFSANPALGFFFQVGIVTFLLLLFGEIIPKVYATYFRMRFALFMTYPLFILERVFRPLSSFLIYSTSIVNKKFQKKQNISMNDLSNALTLTENAIKEDKEILKGIVKFGNIEVKGIMKPRVDVIAIDIKENPGLSEIRQIIAESGFSRIPVYNGTFDDILGILYIKDLLPFLDKENVEFDLKELLRPPYFVPESKKINDLLGEFQAKKIHLAIVIDEYGGTSGIVTMEDILEEIVGEISDEYDDDEVSYAKIDEKNYLFEGKVLLNDFRKVISTPDDFFDTIKGDADTLAGLILELKGDIPHKDEIIKYREFTFKIEAVDKRRIKKIKVTIK